MATFKCKITVPNGDVIEKIFNSTSKAALKARLEQEGNFVLKIEQENRISAYFLEKIGYGIKIREFIGFNEAFCVLLRSGLPVVQAMEAVLEESGKNRLTSFLVKIKDDVKTGESLSNAFGKFTHVFSTLYIATLKSGEKSGDIPSAITNYIEHLKRFQSIKKKFLSASIYPIILTIVSIAVLLFLLVVVVPSLTGTFIEAGAELPGMTQLLIRISNMVKSRWLLILLTMALGLCVWTIFRKTVKGRRIIDRWKISAPISGTISQSYATSKFARSLATLLSAGQPLLEAVNISKQTLENTYLEQKLFNVCRLLEEGAGLSQSLTKQNIFPGTAIKMIDAGEKGGALPYVLNNVATYYENDMETRLTTLTSLIEPLLMVVMGLIIGIIVLAMYMPIFQLAGQI